jgi:hypothetical protein
MLLHIYLKAMLRKNICIWIFAGLALLSHQSVLAQELRCNVIIDTEQLKTVQIAEKQVFVDMQKSISDFLNTRRWTNDRFNPEERINCNLVIRLTNMPSIRTFEGIAQIQSSRPIYGTDYESILLNFVDQQWQFEYTSAQPMDFNENTFNSNLASMLAFYANVIIGLDYDSFGKLGGNPYLQKALNIANTAEQSVAANEKGWKAFEDTRNRYWLIENLTSQQMLPIREGLYTYHRQALDTFTDSPDKSRAQVLELLNTIKKVNQLKPAAVLTNTFFDTKMNELINIFLEGSPQEKQQAYNLLVELDPTKTDKYSQLIK